MSKIILMLNALLVGNFLFNTASINGMQLAINRPSLEDYTLRYIATNLNKFNYKKLRPATLTLLENNPNINLCVPLKIGTVSTCHANLLLEETTKQSDAELMIILLDRNISPNALSRMSVPIFFHAQEKFIAQLLLGYKANLHAIKHCDDTNVLREALKHTHSVDLLNFYIEQGVDGKNKSSDDGSSLFHELVYLSQTCLEKQQANFIAKSKLLLEKFPTMLNCAMAKIISACIGPKAISENNGKTTNNHECKSICLMQTPLNILQKIMIQEEVHSDNANRCRLKSKNRFSKKTINNHRLNIINQLHALYEKHGAICYSNRSYKIAITVQQSDVH